MNASARPRFPAVVIGGSAGALDPLRTFVSSIPSEFGAAIFVVNHVPPDSVSALPHVLSRSGVLFATHAIDGAPIAPGRIIVAPPDRHLIVEDGLMRVGDGPMENGHRPSIDVLFRSAARSFGAGVCAIVLSGTLDDGAAGIVAIHEAGGMTFVQDPDDAQFPDMPLNAIATGTVEGAYPAERLFEAVRKWLAHAPSASEPQKLPPDEREAGSPSVFTCPDCGGTLWELDEGSVLRFRCRTGHAYSAHSMVAAHEDRLESVLWASLRTLQERRDLLKRLVRRSKGGGNGASMRRFERQFREVEADMERVEAVLHSLTAAANPA
ncbi:MAG: chemotaxis protein CheB [Candidatus Eremiobacteraeota bacterium]|nr:chemotaxis protein CheB [Candidatus Eremiobacteraeota bacterium]